MQPFLSELGSLTNCLHSVLQLSRQFGDVRGIPGGCRLKLNDLLLKKSFRAELFFTFLAGERRHCCLENSSYVRTDEFERGQKPSDGH